MNYVPAPRQLGSGQYALENPLSNGELALVFFAGGAMFGITDMISRYIETSAAGASPAPTVANNQITDAFPSGASMGAQAALAILPGIAQAFVQEPWVKASLQAATFGAGFHLMGDLFKGAMAKFFSSNAFVQRTYAAEIAAQGAVTSATPATTSTTPAATGTAGLAGLRSSHGRRLHDHAAHAAHIPTQHASFWGSW